MRSPVTVVQVEEIAALALIKDGGAAQSQGAVAASREARGVDGAGLGRLVVLKLVVASNVTGTTLSVKESAIAESGDKNAVARAGIALLLFISVSRSTRRLQMVPLQGASQQRLTAMGASRLAATATLATVISNVPSYEAEQPAGAVA